MSPKPTVIVLLDEGTDVEDVWTEVARGTTEDELLRQLREYIWKDDRLINEEESTGPPPAYMIHIEGEAEDEDLILFKATLENVAKTAAGKTEKDTITSEREDRKEIEEILREARTPSPQPSPVATGEGEDTDILKVA